MLSWTAWCCGEVGHPAPLPARLRSSSPPWLSSMLTFSKLPYCNCVLVSKEEIRSIPALELEALVQVEFTGGPGPWQRSGLLSIPPRQRLSLAPLSLQHPSPPAPARAAAPEGRIAYLLQIKCPCSVCFNRDTSERISTD